MRRRHRLAAAGIIASLAGAASADQAFQPFVEIPGEQEFSGTMIARPLQVKDQVAAGVPAAAAERRAQSARDALAGYEVPRHYPETDEYIVVVPEGSSENEVARALMATGHFQYVEPNWIVYALECPDDPLLGNQWHHNANRMNSCAGWDIFTGEPSVTVAICDTGIQTNHPDLLLHRREGYNASTQLWESQGGQIGPTGSHGTMVTGCSAANGDNGVGIAGVGWNLSHRMMRVSENGSSSSMEVLTRGARVAVLDAGDRVANVSFSGVTSTSVRTTATVIKDAGGLLVWSAGNNGAFLNWGDRDSDDVIVVGATNSSDQLAGFSARGRSMDLVAPGQGVFTTTTGSGYTNVDGTSFSAPLTAGLIALIWSADPSLTPDEVEQILKQGCDDLGAGGIDDTFGYGRINVLGSLALTSRPLEFEFPGGLPEMVDPTGGTRVRVEVLGADEQPEPGTGKLWYFDGNAYQSVAMEVVSDNVYDAVLPAFTCGEEVSYYFSAETTGGQEISEPRSAPDATFGALAATGIDTLLRDDFEQNNGWTVENINLADGAWERGVPVGGGNRGDPPADFDGSGRCWLTGNRAGDSDVDGGPTRLISPVYDLSGAQGVRVSYARWFTNDDRDQDRLDVEVSADGGSTWTLIESVPDSSGWNQVSFLVEDFVQLSSQVRFRFSATDNPNDSVTEAAIDDFHLFRFECGGCAADIDGDGDADVDDFFAYLDLFAAGDPRADLDGDGAVDVTDFFIYLDFFAAGCDG